MKWGGNIKINSAPTPKSAKSTHKAKIKKKKKERKSVMRKRINQVDLNLKALNKQIGDEAENKSRRFEV